LHNIFTKNVVPTFFRWVPENPSQLKLDQFTITLKHAQLIIVCLSNEFEADKKCVDLLHYIKEILKKRILVVCVGNDYAWQKTSLGIYAASEVRTLCVILHL
jgi:hypothetical protein